MATNWLNATATQRTSRPSCSDQSKNFTFDFAETETVLTRKRLEADIHLLRFQHHLIEQSRQIPFNIHPILIKAVCVDAGPGGFQEFIHLACEADAEERLARDHGEDM